MNDLLGYLSPLDNQQDQMLGLIRELCDVNSGTFNLAGLEAVKSMLIENFAELGGKIQVLDSQPLSLINESGVEVQQQLGQMIHITKWPEANQRILLCIHMDTVYGSDHFFQKCQSLADGNLNGPGVADAKGGLVVMLNALKTSCC